MSSSRKRRRLVDGRLPWYAYDRSSLKKLREIPTKILVDLDAKDDRGRTYYDYWESRFSVDALARATSGDASDPFSLKKLLDERGWKLNEPSNPGEPTLGRRIFEKLRPGNRQLLNLLKTGFDANAATFRNGVNIVFRDSTCGEYGPEILSDLRIFFDAGLRPDVVSVSGDNLLVATARSLRGNLTDRWRWLLRRGASPTSTNCWGRNFVEEFARIHSRKAVLTPASIYFGEDDKRQVWDDWRLNDATPEGKAATSAVRIFRRLLLLSCREWGDRTEAFRKFPNEVLRRVCEFV